MNENLYERVKRPDDPRRCQTVGTNGQCSMVVVEGAKYCYVHQGGSVLKAAEKAKVRNYRIQQYQQRLNELSDSEGLKSLHEEIGVLRMTLEAVLQRCNDSNDLLMYSNKISDLAVKIEKIVNSCHRLEAASGQLIGKTEALNFAQQIVDIVSRHIEDAELLDRISEEILLAVGTISKPS